MILSWTPTQAPTRHLVRIPLSWYFLSQQHEEKTPASLPLPPEVCPTWSLHFPIREMGLSVALFQGS